ncbi:DUF4303 domain-containing protein [Undibacterium sp. Ji42W]|uniref:DUF4303 domain-containing protein n=1 Tax=Undibacterium sp. Ji42W TaxID=3413039 RepID=UPI003BF291FA
MNNYNKKLTLLWAPWVEKNYSELKETIKHDVSQYLSDLRQNHPNQDFYGFSLLTYNGFPSIYPVLNTVEQLKKHTVGAHEKYDQYCPDEWVCWEKNSPFDKANKYIATLHTEFDAINEQYENLEFETVNSLDDEIATYWEKNVERIFETAVDALAELQSEGHFSWIKNEPSALLMIWFPDASTWELNMSRESVKRLNTESTYKEFCEVFELNENEVPLGKKVT